MPWDWSVGMGFGFRFLLFFRIQCYHLYTEDCFGHDIEHSCGFEHAWDRWFEVNTLFLCINLNKHLCTSRIETHWTQMLSSTKPISCSLAVMSWFFATGTVSWWYFDLDGEHGLIKNQNSFLSSKLSNFFGLVLYKYDRVSQTGIWMDWNSWIQLPTFQSLYRFTCFFHL